MARLTMKFGGTSVGSPEAIAQVVEIVRDHLAGGHQLAGARVSPDVTVSGMMMIRQAVATATTTTMMTTMRIDAQRGGFGLL